MMKRFEYLHTVGFEETNLVGNVYFTNHIKWQGKCRELFLKEKAPDLIHQIELGKLALVTLECSCQYLDEVRAFDEILVCLYLEAVHQHKIHMRFEYYRQNDAKTILVAKGIHKVGCFERSEQKIRPIAVPTSLRDALSIY